MNVDHLEKQIREKYKDVLETFQNGSPQFDLMSTTVDEAFELKLVVIKKSERGRGWGEKIMRDLMSFADKNNAIIVLSPSEIKTAKLIQWYKGFNFLENKNRNKDFRFMSRMIRYPHGMTRSKWIDANNKATAGKVPGAEVKKYLEKTSGDIVWEDYGIEETDFELRRVPLKDIQDVRMKSKDAEVAQDYAEIYLNTGSYFPPVVLVGSKPYQIIDGFHRVYAARNHTELDWIDAYVPVETAAAWLDPVSKYNLIEYGANEFSQEQLDAFDEKPTTESRQYGQKGGSKLNLKQALEIRENQYRSRDGQRDYQPEEIDARIWELLSNADERAMKKFEKEMEDMPEEFLQRLEDEAAADLGDVQNSYRYLMGNFPAAFDTKRNKEKAVFASHELKFKLTTIPGQRKAMQDLLEKLSNEEKIEIGRVFKPKGNVGESILEVHIIRAEDKAYDEIMKYLNLYKRMGDNYEMEFDKEFKDQVAASDNTVKDATNMLSLRCEDDGDYESFQSLVGKATIKEFQPKELCKIYRLHGESFFDHSDREPISEDKALDLLYETECPYVVLKSGKYYALDGQHRINTAILCGSPLDIKIVDGKNIDFNTFGYDLPEVSEEIPAASMYPYDSSIDMRVVGKPETEKK
jgi:hypothetical protein